MKKKHGRVPQPKRTPANRASVNRTSRYIPPADRAVFDAHRHTGKPNRGLLGGCGFFVVVIALIGIIALVGFLVVGLANQEAPEPERIPVPADVPPAAAQPAPDIDIHAPGRTSEQLIDWAAPISEETGIPLQALIAYGNAEVIARQNRPECNITWNTLAGLGYVETRHGTYDGKNFGAASLQENGIAEPHIVGPQLNGQGFAKVEDTDGGEVDGDPDFDRAVGPMQFIPESWSRYGIDADGDGATNPHSIDDAAASAVRLLCDHQRDLGTPEGWTRAIRGYNQSTEYVLNVRDAAANYALGQRPL
ncbi:MAG TPA: lytic murein transglycosylase [Candidatus Corynebacterium gallistercoris]|uniref:Lytic murein transglycosylase n=1 Tax=Candidatus Corynebacterium gallistercoris TaxID=2838530 RepID=A0A9D1URL7_9CORY|nr:lytic murein transglycosylase [Candidatus Corynebacterium gallistercoris]